MPLTNPGMPLTVPPAPTSSGTGAIDARTQAFVSTLWPAAVSASRKTGIPPQFLLAQAALETGWGRQEPRLADGRPSYNLFGIKAGSGWSGAVAEASTTEYGANGQELRVVERFRAYASYAEAFDDYARLVSTQPRYAQVLGARDAASFAQGLQSAGYATDPAYADKLMRVIGSPALTMRG
jgi:flagellar protein FlgJ